MNFMNELMIQNDFDVNTAKQDLWMSEEDLDTYTEAKGSFDWFALILTPNPDEQID